MMNSEMTLLSLYCDDLPAMRAFYTERLGLEVVPYLSNDADFIFLKGSGGTPIALRAASGRPKEMPATPGAVEITFDAPDLDAVHADFTAHGVPILSGITDMGAGHMFLAHDPAGNILSIAQLNDDVRAARTQRGM
ncbi:MAG: VOC family protein [Ktedonobacterales bacterium]